MFTIMDMLKNARYNLTHSESLRNPALFAGMACEQLSNAIKLIDEGKGLYDEVLPEDIKKLNKD